MGPGNAAGPLTSSSPRTPASAKPAAGCSSPAEEPWAQNTQISTGAALTATGPVPAPR